MSYTNSKVEGRGTHDERAAGCGDEYIGAVPQLLSTKELRELSQLRPWIATCQIILEWASIFLAVVVADGVGGTFVYLVSVVWIGARMHALAVLMHEGVHYRLYRHRKLNDFVSEVVLTWPLFFSMRGFRRVHLAHHRHPNTVDDPDWVRKKGKDWEFPKSWPGLVWLLTKNLFALNLVQKVREITPYRGGVGGERVFLIGRIGFYVVGAVIATYFQWWRFVLIYWLVPFFTWLSMTAHLRSIADHFAIAGAEGFTGKTRTTKLSLLERLLFAPNNINYHVEHHLYPSVPYYSLPELHERLMSKPEFRSRTHITKGLIGLFRECMGREASL